MTGFPGAAGRTGPPGPAVSKSVQRVFPCTLVWPRPGDGEKLRKICYKGLATTFLV